MRLGCRAWRLAISASSPCVTVDAGSKRGSSEGSAEGSSQQQMGTLPARLRRLHAVLPQLGGLALHGPACELLPSLATLPFQNLW